MGSLYATNKLISECYDLALSLSVRPRPIDISNELWNEIWFWVDRGRCSLQDLQQSTDFDMAKEESSMQTFLARMKNIKP
jgi:hypothetical protein